MIELRPLSTLDAATVQATLTETVQRLQEANPYLDLRRGVFAELLAYYHAVLDTQRRANIQDYQNARSLLAIEADPTLADSDIVDDVVSNFRLDRKQGQKASGEVIIVISSDVTVNIGQGSVWQARSQQYVTTMPFTAKVESAQIVALGDRLITPTADGNFAFTITVEAVNEGTDSNLTKDTLIVPVITPTSYVTSYAASDFTTGLLPETTEDLLVRLQAGIAARALSNRINMSANLRAIDAFSRVVGMSIVGYGDGELTRAFHSILPIALGGRCDWYIRTQEQSQTITLAKTCRLLVLNADNTGVWQFSIGRDEVPGFYEFRQIRPVSETSPILGGYTVVSDVRGLDMTAPGVLPDLIDYIEAAYSAFSTAVVQFLDTSDNSALVVGATRDYNVGVVSMPLIGDIQTQMGSRDVRPYGGDCLVKAPVPCFLTVNFTINKKTGQDDPNLDGIKDAICTAVNETGFVGAMYASQIQDAIHPYLADGQTVSAIDMFGRIRYPDGTTIYLRDTEVLNVPDAPANMVTAKTVQFFGAPEDVGITVVTKLPTAL